MEALCTARSFQLQNAWACIRDFFAKCKGWLRRAAVDVAFRRGLMAAGRFTHGAIASIFPESDLPRLDEILSAIDGQFEWFASRKCIGATTPARAGVVGWSACNQKSRASGRAGWRANCQRTMRRFWPHRSRGVRRGVFHPAPHAAASNRRGVRGRIVGPDACGSWPISLPVWPQFDCQTRLEYSNYRETTSAVSG